MGCTPAPAGPADVPALAALYRRCGRELGPQVYDAAQVAAWVSFGDDEARFRDYVLTAETVLVRAAGGDPVGFCGWCWQHRVPPTPSAPPTAEVRSLYVRPDHAGQGLGTALLADALRRAAAVGATRAEAWATPFSRSLFTRAGMPLVAAVVAPFQGVMFERYRMGGAVAPARRRA